MAYFATAKVFADPFGSFLRGFRQAQEDDRNDLRLLDRYRRTALAARAEERQMLSLLLDEEYRRDKFEYGKQKDRLAAIDPQGLADSLYDGAAGQGAAAQPPVASGGYGGDQAEEVAPPPAKIEDRIPVETPPARAGKIQDRIPTEGAFDMAPPVKMERVAPPEAAPGAALAAPVPVPQGGRTLSQRAILGRDAFRNPEIPSPADAPAQGRLKDYLSSPPQPPSDIARAKRALDEYMKQRGLGEYAKKPAPLPPPEEPPGPLPPKPAGSRKYIHDRIPPDPALEELQRATGLVQQISRALNDPNLTPAARAQLQQALQRVRQRIQQLRGQ